jgi:hypothetical protein
MGRADLEVSVCALVGPSSGRAVDHGTISVRWENVAVVGGGDVGGSGCGMGVDLVGCQVPFQRHCLA